MLEPGDLFVDVGAWIGPVTLWAMEHTSNIIAIEPDPIALDELHGNCSTVEIWDGAVTASDVGIAHLAANPKDGGFYGDSMSRLATTGVPVPAWTLPAILHGRIPKLVKIDIEGGEVDLAPWLVPWLAERHVAVQISCHGTLLDRSLFDGYTDITIPVDSWGDIVALP